VIPTRDWPGLHVFPRIWLALFSNSTLACDAGGGGFESHCSRPILELYER